MLVLIVPGIELFNEQTETFETAGDFELELEHSLVSLSKWESKFKKPFLSSIGKSREEIMTYIEFMILTPIYPPEIFNRMSQENLDAINDYIESSESATTFGVMPERKERRGEVITSELIYYWMVAFTIPFECECWHLNRLFALIRICNIKNSKQKKMSRNEIAMRNREINAQRRAQYNTTG